MLSPLVLLLVLALLGILAAVGAVVYSTTYSPRAKLRRRMMAVVGAPAGRKGMGLSFGFAKGQAGGPGSAKKKQIQSKLKELEEARKRKKGVPLRTQLVQAGLAITPRQFWIWSAVAGVLGAGLMMLSGLPKMVVPAGAILFGLGVPRFVLNHLIKRRVKKFTEYFADALDVIVRGIRSGLPVGECFNMIAREAPDPVGIEFRLITEGQRVGLTLMETLERACERTPTPEMRFFAIVLGIQQTTGGNLAETLAKLSDVLRQRKRMRDKVQAMSSEAKASAGIIGSLPIIVGTLLSFIAFDYVAELWRSDGGQMLMVSGAGIMFVGIMVMRQMINFDM